MIHSTSCLLLSSMITAFTHFHGGNNVNGIKIRIGKKRKYATITLKDFDITAYEISASFTAIPYKEMDDMKLVTEEHAFTFGNPEKHDLALYSTEENVLTTIIDKGLECLQKNYTKFVEITLSKEDCQKMKSRALDFIKKNQKTKTKQ